MNISGQTFVITGGGSGLGKATVMDLAARNANVAIADVDSDASKELAASLKANAFFVYTDVTDSASVESALTETIDRYGSIDGVVNCAGVLSAGRVLNKDGGVLPLDEFRHCIDVNLNGTFNTVRLVSKILASNSPHGNNERGVIINTASIAAYEGQIGQVAYAASKAGIIGMTLPLARELGRFGIRVMTIAPGVFDTPLFSELDSDKRAQLEQQIPFPQRLGKPSDFAALVKHTIENPMLNGETIRLDGGLRMAAR